MSLEAIERLVLQLKLRETAEEKIKCLDAAPSVDHFLKGSHPLRSLLDGLSTECEIALKQWIAIGQAPLSQENVSAEDVRELLKHLVSIDHFYREIGGIAGYQAQVLRLLKGEKENQGVAVYHAPAFIDISQGEKSIGEAIEAGISSMPLLAEMYPLGGAADRLHLIDEKTGHELPAAKLEFAGETLLGRLLRDLQAREFLYYKRFGEQLTTPVAIMTSHEKDNWSHVQEILEQNNWFGRPKDSFRLFVQPLVPSVNGKGEWQWSAPWKPLLKPGGHGAIWKLAKDNGIFDWLRSLGRRYALIRQINNPLAGVDYGLLAFTGIGCKERKIFGFASCPRLLQSAEGVNVLVERKTESGFSYVLSNIEYCDFVKYGIEDLPLKAGEPYSRYHSNTNILFAELSALEQAVEKCPFPGLLMNLKKNAGSDEPIGRLESTMQNIADVFVEERKTDGEKGTERTFVTYNRRHKTISPAKKAFQPGGSLNETPEKSFYDLMIAHRELLSEYCHFKLPEEKSLEEVLATHPPFVFLFHPALGPLYAQIGEKLSRGRLSEGAELCLELADGRFEDIDVEGSLRIIAKQPLGRHWETPFRESCGSFQPQAGFRTALTLSKLAPFSKPDLWQKISRNLHESEFPSVSLGKMERNQIRFSEERGRCELKNVRVNNRGVDWARSSPFWRARFVRQESAEIILEGHSEFIAEDVEFDGAVRFVVKNGERLRVTPSKGGLQLERTKLTR